MSLSETSTIRAPSSLCALATSAGCAHVGLERNCRVKLVEQPHQLVAPRPEEDIVLHSGGIEQVDELLGMCELHVDEDAGAALDPGTRAAAARARPQGRTKPTAGVEGRDLVRREGDNVTSAVGGAVHRWRRRRAPSRRRAWSRRRSRRCRRPSRCTAVPRHTCSREPLCWLPCGRRSRWSDTLCHGALDAQRRRAPPSLS